MGEHLKLAGDWCTVSQTNTEQMLSKIGAPPEVCQAAALAKPVQTISFEGSSMKVINIAQRTRENTIPLDGSEFSEEVFSKTFVARATVNGDGSVAVTGMLGDMVMTAVRKIDDAGQMVMTITVDSVESSRVFARK